MLVSAFKNIVLYFIFDFLSSSSAVTNRRGGKNFLIFILQTHETTFGFNGDEVAGNALGINRTEARIKTTNT
jgi:hypothetical protein